MGEVFRARDTRLGREVAIKLLPPAFAAGPERLARFEREAKLLASLNHPGIAAIHGLEEADGQPFLVLELVPGEDLAERLKRGPVPIDEAVAIAGLVAEALEEAHKKGIVHRDHTSQDSALLARPFKPLQDHLQALRCPRRSASGTAGSREPPRPASGCRRRALRP
jgi:serine/threonine protein kinase